MEINKYISFLILLSMILSIIPSVRGEFTGTLGDDEFITSVDSTNLAVLYGIPDYSILNRLFFDSNKIFMHFK